MSRKRSFRLIPYLALLLGLGATALPTSSAKAYDAQFEAMFNPQALETPESVAIDLEGNKYISMALTGEIRKIDKFGNQSTHAQMPLGAPLTFCGGVLPNIMGALAIDLSGNLYVGVGACEPELRGVYKVYPDGSYELLANAPLDAGLNGIALRLGKLYVADAFKGVIYRLPKNGGPLEVWADHPLLKQVPAPFMAPGPNGVQFYEFELYVSNSSTEQIIAIPIRLNGTAGEPRVHAQLNGAGCDDFAFDVDGALYCTTDPYNLIIKVNPDGSSENILTEADGLNGPTAAAFGRLLDRHTLYITNAAFPFFPVTTGPSLMSVELEVPGYPFR